MKKALSDTAGSCRPLFESAQKGNSANDDFPFKSSNPATISTLIAPEKCLVLAQKVARATVLMKIFDLSFVK
jgi:hypothetical protein